MATLASGQVVAARYELVRPLGSSPDGATWLARDAEGAADVVLRFRAAAAHAGVQDEIHHAVVHPALLAPIATHDEEGRVVDVLPWIPGGESGRLRGRPWTLIVRRLLPVVDALGRLHDAGWVHGDLKSANVLLDADGLMRLADFGSARRLGATQPAGASPYSTSPERLDGAPAAASDDIYAFGVLLYELVSGHPPFYPELTPERVRTEMPALLAGRPEPPAELRALAARCLAKRPEDRPASMQVVRDELELCLAAPATAEVPAAAPSASSWQPRPPADSLPVQSQWRRTTTTAPTAQALRSEGFRRGLLVGALALALATAGFTFFVLPGLVASRQPVAVPASVPAPPVQAPQPQVDLQQLAELKKRAEDRRAPLAERLRRLEQRDLATWGGAAPAAIRADLAAGDAAHAAHDYRAALARFDAAAAGLDALDQRASAVLRERLAAAQAAFRAGRSAAAQEAFAAALRIAPDEATARTGLARSRVLDDVLRETAAGARAEQAGTPQEALAAYRRALALDPATTVAREGIARLTVRQASDAYSAAMAQALAALARRDYPAAQAAFGRAERLRPGTPEVAEGLAQIRRATETQSLASTVDRAAAAERAERWSEALGLYREALKTEPALRAAQDGVERAEPRTMIDAELQSFIDKPERLYNPGGRDVARNVLERAARVASPGPRLQGQQSRLAELLHQAETPIRVALASDNATDVQIYRIGKLGLFEHRDLELMPGRYTVVGTRQGYRDVRKELNLLPGTPPPTLVVRCEEPI